MKLQAVDRLMQPDVEIAAATTNVSAQRLGREEESDSDWERPRNSEIGDREDETLVLPEALRMRSKLADG